MKSSDEMARTVLHRLEAERRNKKCPTQRRWVIRLLSLTCYLGILVGAFSLWQRSDAVSADPVLDAPGATAAAALEAAPEQTEPAETTVPAAEQTEPAEPLLTAPERELRFSAVQLVIENGLVVRHLVLTGAGQPVPAEPDPTGMTVEQAFLLLLKPLVDAGYIAGDTESAPVLMLAAYDENGYDKNGRLVEVVERDGLGAAISAALAEQSITQRILERDQTDTEYVQMLEQLYNTSPEQLQPVLEQIRSARELALKASSGRIVAELFAMDVAKELVVPKCQSGDYDQYGELILYGPGIEAPAPGWSQADVSPEIWATYVRIYTPEDLAMLMRPRIWTTMTNVVGMNEEEAGTLLRSREIVPRVIYEDNEEYRALGFTDGQVFMQDAEPGMRWNSDASVFIWVMASRIPEPEFNGLSQGWHPDGYDPTQSQEFIGEPAEKSSHVMKAWVGEFSEEALKNTISVYQNQFPNVVSGSGEKLSQVSFETDFQIATGGIARLAFVDDRDPNVELKSYIDLYVDMIWNGNSVTIHTDWWYRDSSWVSEHPVWAYLVWLKDTNGTIHYYYFRTEYTGGNT